VPKNCTSCALETSDSKAYGLAFWLGGFVVEADMRRSLTWLRRLEAVDLLISAPNLQLLLSEHGEVEIDIEAAAVPET